MVKCHVATSSGVHIKVAGHGATDPSGCIWCGGRFTSADFRDRAWVSCSRCGVATTAPWPTARDLDLAYSTWYRPATGRFGGIGDRALQRTRGALARRQARVIPPGPVLDVGAGTGALVDAVGRRGHPAIGVERPRNEGLGDTGDVVATLDGPPVVLAAFEDVRGAWSGVVFWHSLEHLAAPGRALDRAASLLEPGGVIVIAIPNHGSLQATLFGARWFARDIPRHLAHITCGALLYRLSNAGLTIRRVSYLGGGQVLFGWLDGLVGSLPGGLRLYDAIRSPEARAVAISPSRRAITLAAALLLVPGALLATAVEVAIRRGGTVYVEASR